MKWQNTEAAIKCNDITRQGEFVKENTGGSTSIQVFYECNYYVIIICSILIISYQLVIF